MARNFTEDDQGKKVTSASGDEIGMISKVEGSTAYVDPDPNVADRIMSRLGWGDVDDDNYPLRSSQVDRITDDEVRLKRDL